MQLNWSVRELAEELSPKVTGRNEKVEEPLRRKYSPLEEKIVPVRSPCTVIDSEGVVVLVYVRDAFTKGRQVSRSVLPEEKSGDSRSGTLRPHLPS